MKSTSSITRSKSAAWLGLASIGLGLSGCAIAPVPGPAPALPESRVESSQPKPTLLTIEYGNRSSKASIQLDLSGSEVQLEMTGSREPSDSTRRTDAAVPNRQAARNAAANTPEASRAAAASDDSGTAQARRIVDSAGKHPAEKSLDSTLRQVVQHIRKAQELFYAGRYPEAEDNARRANELKPTPEGLALAGSIAWVRKDREGARRNWLKARELDPDFPGLAAVLDPPVSAPAPVESPR